jgi:hypothetical protein
MGIELGFPVEEGPQPPPSDKAFRKDTDPIRLHSVHWK